MSTALVYKYGTPARAAKAVPEHIEEQFRLAHQLRNALVETHERYEAALAAAWAAHPECAAADDAVRAAEEAVLAIVQRMKAERVEDRSTKPRPESKTELREAKAAHASAKAHRKSVRDSAYPVVKTMIDAAKQAEWAEQKALYGDFVQTRGLFWASYNDVLDHHKTAIKRVTADRKAGKPAQLRFHRYDGTGTITIQLQRGKDQPQRTPALFASGEGPWRGVFQLRPWMDPAVFDQLSRAEQRRAGHGVALLRFGANSPTWELPVQVHRMIPADADITLVRVTRTRVGAQHRLALTVTVKLPETPRADNREAAALHLGWRARTADGTATGKRDGSIRVGTVVAASALNVPDHLADVIETRGDGTWGEIVLPGALRGAITKGEDLRSIRDKALDLLRMKLSRWLTDHGSVERVHPRTGEVTELRATDVDRWRAPGRFAALTIEWRTLADNSLVPEGTDWPIAEFFALVTEMEAWRKQDKHLWEWEAHGRDQYIERRNDAWRRAAAWLTTRFGVIVVSDTNVADLAPVPTIGQEDTAQDRAARALRVLAAPATLRAAITNAADRRGVTITSDDATTTKTTVVHLDCGHENPRTDPTTGEDRYKQAVLVTCLACGNTYDQDRNAARHALATLNPLAG